MIARVLALLFALVLVPSCSGAAPGGGTPLVAISLAVDVAAQGFATIDQAHQIGLVGKAPSRDVAEHELARYRLARASIVNAAASVKRRVDWILDQAVANDAAADAAVRARWPDAEAE